MNLEGKILLKKIGPPVMSRGSEWVYYDVLIDTKYYTAEQQVPQRIRLLVHKETNYMPLEGDIVKVRKNLKDPRNSWFYVDGDFENTYSYKDAYKREKIDPQIYEFAGISVSLYKYPDFANLHYFEIKPVICYYNEITGEELCEIVDSNTIDISLHPDSIMWSIFERLKNKKINCIADFYKVSEANKVYMDLRAVHDVMKQLINN